MAPRPAPGTRADYRAFRTIPTRWMDGDVYGHVNNAVYYSFFDTAVNGWLIGAGLLASASSARIGLVAETGCRFHSELRFPDNVAAGLRVARLGLSSVRYEIGLFRGEQDTASAEGFFVHVYVDAESRRPMPLSADLRAGLAGLQPKKTAG